MRGMPMALMAWWSVALVAATAAIVLLAILLTHRATRKLRYKIAELRDYNAALNGQVQSTIRRFDEQFTKISGYLSERDEWMQLYHQQSAEHGTAQAMMLAERQQLIHQLVAAGLKPRVNGVIERVAKGFADTHVEAARRRGRPGEVGSELEGRAGSDGP